MATGTGTRASYHHGDLANALTEAATELARRGGPDAVVLREVARQVGVSATAAYRHFAGHPDLIHAVKERALQTLAERMLAEVASGAPEADRGAEALRQIRAIGTAYIHFALAEPGLFRTAFCRRDDPNEVSPPGDPSTFRSYQLLAAMIDQMVEVGLVSPRRRPHAEIAAWSAVHGLALLMLDGPLRGLPEAEREVAIADTLDLVTAGLCAPGNDPA